MKTAEKKAKTEAGPRVRVKELLRVRGSDLRVNEKNWRTHTTEQKEWLSALVNRVGIADALIAYPSAREGGALVLIDGHARREGFETAEWPVLVLDVTDEEADLLLASLDPIAALAEADEAHLKELIASLDIEDEAMLKGIDSYLDLAGFEDIAGKEAMQLGDEPDPIESPDLEPTSNVKMFQLYFDQEQHAKFSAWISDLQAQLGLDNPTDTVYELARRAAGGK